MKKNILYALVVAISFTAGYQFGYWNAPQQPVIQLVMPPHWIPDKQPTVETI